MVSQSLFDLMQDLLEKNIDVTHVEQELWEKFGRTCALLVLDSAKFTETTKKRGILHFLAIILKMREFVIPVMQKHSCLSYRVHADNVVAEFDTPTQAVEAAIEANQLVQNANIELFDQERFGICIGIGYGNVLYADEYEGYHGDEMNVASKLGEDTAQRGEILLTASAYAHLDHRYRNLFEQRQLTMSDMVIPYYLTAISEDK